MTQSDKDFITRIQVSQLVTQDPYSDDFYAQAYGAIMRSRMGIPTQDERVLKFGSGGGIGLGVAPKGAHRRQSAMQKMEQQVERIVSNARRREEEKGLHCKRSDIRTRRSILTPATSSSQSPRCFRQDIRTQLQGSPSSTVTSGLQRIVNLAFSSSCPCPHLQAGFYRCVCSAR